MHASRLIGALLVSAAAAQQPTTTVKDRMVNGNGVPLTGVCTFQTQIQFVSGAGYTVIGVPQRVRFAGGDLTVQLVPTDTASSPNVRFEKTCHAPLQTIAGQNCEASPALVGTGACLLGPQDWGPTYLQVPTSASVVQMKDIETPTAPAPLSSQWKGNWSGSTPYRVGDMVFCPAGGACGGLSAGISYVAIQGGNLNHPPGTSSTWWSPVHARQSGDYDSFDMAPRGYWNFSSGRVRLPEATFASPPASPQSGQTYLFTDAKSPGRCVGGGSSLAECRWRTGGGWDGIVPALDTSALPDGRYCLIVAGGQITGVGLCSTAIPSNAMTWNGSSTTWNGMVMTWN